MLEGAGWNRPLKERGADNSKSRSKSPRSGVEPVHARLSNGSWQIPCSAQEVVSEVAEYESTWVSFSLIPLEDGTATNPYPAEFRERTLRILTEARPDHPSDFAAASHVARRLGVNPETLRLWKKRADVNTCVAPGTTSEAQAEIKGPKKQIAELEKANEILRSASVFFATGLGRTSSR